MATVNQVNPRARSTPFLPTLERSDYVAAATVGLLAAGLAALRLGMWPIQHASLDPQLNRGFLFGILEQSAATCGNVPTVLLAGMALALLTLQVAMLAKQSR